MGYDLRTAAVTRLDSWSGIWQKKPPYQNAETLKKTANLMGPSCSSKLKHDMQLLA
jgi:hypothetical protein